MAEGHAWTQEQAAAITARDHVLLAASAGTGKTSTVVGKVLWHLGLPAGAGADGAPLPPCPDPCGLEAVAAITFTEKAAYDLKRKLRRELEATERGRELRWEVDRASVGTIHAFCAELLRDHALRLDIDPTFRVLDERETRLHLDELLRDLILERLRAGHGGTGDLVRRCGLYGYENTKGAIDQVRAALRDVRWRASRYRAWRDAEEGRLDAAALERTARELGAWDENDGDGAAADRRILAEAAVLHDLAREAAGRWLARLERENVRDFDSLVLDARRLLTRPETRPALAGIRRRYRLLVVDEFQDTDAAQRDIAFAIAGLHPDTSGSGGSDAATLDPGAFHPGGEGPQLFLVGDAKQSVYGFRGADITVWNSVREALCGKGEPLQLTHNFRSEPAVVRFVNRVGGHALGACATAVEEEAPESRVPYRDLAAWRQATRAGRVEWLAVDEEVRAAERRELEGRRVAARVRELVDDAAPVVDPQTGELRPCRLSDVAVLARTRAGLAAVEAELRAREIPSYDTAASGLSGRQEVADAVTVLRLLCDPHDDLRAFAFLRSPCVGLRDEVLARIRLDETTGRTSLLRQAERWLEGVEEGRLEPFPAPEAERVEPVEREALRRGLAALQSARELVDRAPHPELLEDVLRGTGYRLHLLLREGSREALANLERFLALLDEYRHLPLGTFLDLWERWGEQDLGIPRAPLYSADDDVVTLSTIHGAKGLEWPVVFLVNVEERPSDAARRLVNEYRSDAELGPALLPKGDERGPRCERLFRRTRLEQEAEEARLLYVATTRARDRLIVVGPTEPNGGHAAWLAVALEEAVEARELAGRETSPATARGGDRASRSEDPVTGTGAQIDVFGFHEDPEDGNGQFSLFAATPAGSEDGGVTPEAAGGVTDGDGGGLPEQAPLVVVRRGSSSLQTRLEEPPVSLEWLEDLEPAEPPALVAPVEVARRSLTTSATELHMRAYRPDDWELRYVHGVEPAWRFAPPTAGEDGLPATIRGQIIHGVLERIREEAEMARILEETVAGVHDADVEELLRPGARYREALEREIRRVVRSPEWTWYVSPPHDPARHRELSFVHLAEAEAWRVGALDLYRPSRSDGDAWIIDFKTHRIEAAAAERTAGEYRVQASVYRAAAEAILGFGSAERATPDAPGEEDSAGRVRIALHFTHPNVAVEVDRP